MSDVMNQPVAAQVVRIGPFMLPQAEPATPLPADVADARALRAALAEKSTPYDQVRRDLGLK